MIFLSEQGGIPPPVDNKELEDKLVTMDNQEGLQENEDFILINRKLWEFVLSLYGGGPTITANKEFFKANKTSSGRSYKKETVEERYEIEEQGSFEIDLP